MTLEALKAWTIVFGSYILVLFFRKMLENDVQ